MKIVVTGGAGFIGSHLCAHLLDEGHSVLCVNNLLTGSEQNEDGLRRTIEWFKSQWVNFYNTTRPHESLGYRSPDQYAQEQQLGSVPSLTLF